MPRRLCISSPASRAKFWRRWNPINGEICASGKFPEGFIIESENKSHDHEYVIENIFEGSTASDLDAGAIKELAKELGYLPDDIQEKPPSLILLD